VPFDLSTERNAGKGIYELMKITDPLRELINERAPGRAPLLGFVGTLC
jgi:hypothetical protein